MAQVTLSKEARRDLVSIRNYIRDELCNPDAAAHAQTLQTTTSVGSG